MKKLDFLFFAIFAISVNFTIASDNRIKRSVEQVENSENSKYQFRWFEQKTDHFNPRDDRTFQQRYYVNDDYFKSPNGPVFLFVGGRSEVKEMHSGSGMEYAKEVGALCFHLEHRFYGKSHLYLTEDLKTENIRSLTMEAAVGDLANFVSKMNQRYNLTRENRWIALGADHGGSLSVWLRKKYSHLVYGAIASSAPLLAKIDFPEFMQAVKKSLMTYKKADCITPIQKGFRELKNLVDSKKVEENLKLCDPIDYDNPLDVTSFYNQVVSVYAKVVEYHNIPGFNLKIDEICDIMTSENIESPVERVREVIKTVLEKQSESCLNFKYEKIVENLKNTSFESEYGMTGKRQWFYQTCTEFGFFKTSTFPGSSFDTINEDFFLQMCKDVFGETLDRNSLQFGVESINLQNGGLNPTISNVLLVHGSLDPWRILGLPENVENQNEKVIIIEGESHCSEMYASSENDSSELKEARISILKFIKALLE